MIFGQDFLDANMIYIFCWILIDDCVSVFSRCVIFLQLHDTWSHYASSTYSANPNSEGR